jgi:parvulin-like peptidyl-prolyl isomerase
MMHWMRKHTKVILIGVCVVVVPTFVVWGGYAGRSRSGRGGRGSQSEGPTPVATVGQTPITTAEFQQRLNDEIERRSQYTGKRSNFSDLAADGAAERVLEGMINSRLLTMEVSKMKFSLDRSYLGQRLRKDPAFQDENGKFNPALWNAWIDSDQKRNWNAIYADLTTQAARDVLLRRVVASARVLDSDIRKQFEDNHTKLQIKYVEINPKIEPPPDQIQAQYDKDPTKYQIPEKRNAEFIAISLAAPRPAIVDEVVNRARAGEDFAGLAKQYSQVPDKDKGGSLDWLDPEPDDPDFLKPVFSLPVGSVSDAIPSAGAYYIYKVEQERTVQATGARSVNARHIVIVGKLGDAEQAAREQKADELAAKVKTAGDLKAPAAEAGLTVQATQGVSADSLTIDNVPPEDARAFRTDLAALGQGEISGVIKARSNLYVAKVTQVDPPVLQPIETVRQKVTEDTIENIRLSPEHREQVKALADKVAAAAKSLQDIVTMFPELGAQIKESKEFTRKDFLVSEGLMCQTVDIYDAVGRKEPGAFGGPIRGFRENAYFVELVKKTPPTDEEWQNDWPKEEDSLRKSAVAAKRNQLLSDYLTDLRDRVAKDVPIHRDYVAIGKVLGTEKEEAQEAPEQEEKPSRPVPPPVVPNQPFDFGPPASE